MSFGIGGPTLTMSGTPTAPGTYQFVITVTTPSGDFMSKLFTLCVVDIDQSSLPDALLGVPYFTTLTATACAQVPQSWEIVSGNLPAGLTLDTTTGLISGTPTGPTGTVTFRVEFQTAAT